MNELMNAMAVIPYTGDNFPKGILIGVVILAVVGAVVSTVISKKNK